MAKTLKKNDKDEFKFHEESTNTKEENFLDYCIKKELTWEDIGYEFNIKPTRKYS